MLAGPKTMTPGPPPKKFDGVIPAEARVYIRLENGRTHEVTKSTTKKYVLWTYDGATHWFFYPIPRQ